MFLTMIAFACADNQLQVPDFDVQALTISTQYYNDWSNTVHTIVVEESYGDAQMNVGAALVPSDYVLIGGGAYTTNTSAGGYLTGSYPYLPSNSWYASSKDHWSADPHTLRVIAVGLKIDGVSATTLRNSLQFVNSNWSSPVAAHPTNSISVSAGYNLISGGANISWVNCNGNLLTASYPSGSTWNVASKDHVYSCPANIQAYAIGIPSTISGFNGQLEVTFPMAGPVTSNGTHGIATGTPTGWAPASVGGRATYTAGRLFTTLRPPYAGDPTGSQGIVKDMKILDSGSTYLYASSIRKKP